MATRSKTTKAKRAVKKAVGKVKAVAKKKPAARRAAPAKSAPSYTREQCATVDEYILSVGPPARAVLETLRDTVMTAVPGAACVIKWGQPVFEYDGPIAWMKAFGKHVSFGFFRGTELKDPGRILEGTGGRMRHVKIKDPTLIPVAKIDALVRQAADLNKAKGAPRISGEIA